ncbi:hypothetical protein [Streptomyces tauricus]|uniref:hypothetical protein n=1 Tax=Streptomyces tauricus TaxID=68274 RepID=UPI0034222626
MDGSETEDAPTDGMEPELFNLFQFTVMSRAFGIPEEKVTGDFRNSLEDLRQREIVTLSEMAGLRAGSAGEAKEHPASWAAGFAEGYLAAWAAAILRVLDTRGLDFGDDKHLFRPLHVSTDADLLTRLLDRAVTVTREADLVAGEPSLQ